MGPIYRTTLHRGAIITMATFTAYLFTTLDGFGTGPVGYWGKDGPELREYHARTFFAGEDETLVLGANTFRLMAGFAAEQDKVPEFESLSERPKVVISRTLEEPLTWPNSQLIAEDALDAVPRLKAESSVPLRSHGSISMNRALLAAGLASIHRRGFGPVAEMLKRC